MNWSHSRLSLFRKCPRAYEWQYRAKLGPTQEPMPQLEAGSELHRLLAEYGEHCFREGKDIDPRMAETIAGHTDDANVQRQFLVFAERQVWDFLGLLGGPEGQHFETWHEQPLPDGLGKFRGRVDYLALNAGHLTILDWKSGWHTPTQPERPTSQLLYYAWLLVNELGEQVETIELKQEIVASGCVWIWDVGPGEMIDVEEDLCERVREVFRAEKQYNEGRWPAEPGSHCAGCGYRAQCEASFSLAATVRAQDLVDAINLRAAGRSWANKALQEHCQEHGPFVDRDGQVWDRYPNPPKHELRKGKLGEAIAALTAAKYDAEKILLGGKFDLIAKDPRFAKLFKEKRAGFTWGSRRPTVVEEQAEPAAEEAETNATEPG